jgi:hypothetical protein
MSDEYDDEYEYEGAGSARWVIAAVAAVALAAGAFFAGQALAGDGPATLAEAVEQAQAGELPCGEEAEVTPGAQGGPPAGGGFAVRALCDRGQGANGRPAAGLRGGFGGPSGEVVSLDGDKLTLKAQQGTITVTLGPETAISKASKGAASDLKAGQTVVVGGAGRPGQDQTGTAGSVLITD